MTDFKKKIKSDISDIKSSPDGLIFAYKTSNIYEAAPQEYNRMLKDIVTKSKKKSTGRLEKSINIEVKDMANKIQLSDRIECLARTTPFITLKDHKNIFQSSLPYQLINPPKSELGKICKWILENINQHLVKLLYVNQWKSSTSVFEDLKNIKDKKITHPSQKPFLTRFYCLQNNITAYQMIIPD